MRKIRFGIVGGGWRAEFYLRIARALPERFEAARVCVRDEAKGKALADRWGIRAVCGLDAFLDRPDYAFAVVAVAKPAAASHIAQLARAGVPVLAETPPAETLADLRELYAQVGANARIQVAEQYAFQPLHAARLAAVRSGKLGRDSYAHVSAAHGYHGISLIRRLLGVGFEEAEIAGTRFAAPLIKGPGRSGPPEREARTESVQDIATLRFGDRMAVYDFTYDQYFSWIRGNRVLIRGDRGEIENAAIRYLEDFRTPIYGEFRRVDAGQDGNLEGYGHLGVLLGAEWVYRNPFAPARLTDEEIAIATALGRMSAYCEGGPSFYGLAEAA